MSQLSTTPSQLQETNTVETTNAHLYTYARTEEMAKRAHMQVARVDLNPFLRKCRLFQLTRFLILNFKILKVALFPPNKAKH